MIRKYSNGMDMAKKSFKACLSSINNQQEVKVKASSSFNNTLKGYERFWLWHLKHAKEDVPTSFTMEATGSYHEKLAWFLYNKKQTVHIVLPNRAKAYLISLGNKSKNDKVDAKGLSNMGAVQKLIEWKPISKQLYQLRGLTRHLEDLQSLRTSLINQKGQNAFGMFEIKQVTKSIEKTLKALDKQIETCKKDIQIALEKDEQLSKKANCIMSIKGVSTITAAIVIAETNGFELIRNIKQLVSYAGYDVRQNQSGQMDGKTRITKKGNAHIRRAMHLPAFNMVRYDVKPFKDLYTRVYDRTGVKMKAYVAIQRKLLTFMYILWKKEELFNSGYSTSGDQETKPSFSVDSLEPQKQTAESKESAALDRLPYDQSTEAFFSVT